jgi:arabinan endo-1,5-alpha-L-arabinosidase
VMRSPAPAPYTNPLRPQVPGDGIVESCADPTVVPPPAQGGDWHLLCTTDPLNDADTSGAGDVVFHPIPTMASSDLVHWRYIGDALTDPPAWAAPGAGFWAPDVVYSKATERYYLTFVVTDTTDEVSGEPGCAGDNAIGVATSRSADGPWTVSPTPVVGPRRAGPGCDFYWTFDPDVLGDRIGSRGILYYGSYYGGVHATRVSLAPDGMTAVGEQHDIAMPNRYEGANVARHGDWYYLFGSATNCCNGPLTGYSVFAGRSQSPFGPFVDKEGNSFLAGRVGGTPVISMNGNRWVGPGHNSVFRDFDGQWWTVYHAVNRFDPYFATEPGFTKRPALLDPVDWVDGWPTVRAGRWASDSPMPGPAAQPGEKSRYRPHPAPPDRLGTVVRRLSDAFNRSTLGPRWTWVREPAPDEFSVEAGELTFTTQAADLYVDTNDASVLTEPTPQGDYAVEVKVRLPVPAEGCCHNYAQAGLVVYAGDDRFVKLTHTSIWETRQTEFAKEVASAPAGYPRYGNTVVGPPGEWTYLRIVRRARDSGGELYRAYTSQDGTHWTRGGVWTHRLGDDARIGLVSMGIAPTDPAFDATFDYVRVWRLRPLS